MKNSIDAFSVTRDAPQCLQVEVTSRCNLKCKMCPLTTGDTLSSTKPDHMSDIIWEDIVPLAKRCGEINLTGYGEPFLNPNFLPLLQNLDREGVRIGFSTNGTLLTPEIARELAKLKHIIQINFSIDSPKQDSYRFIRGGDVEKALSGLKNLTAAIDDPRVITISSVLMTQNIKDLVHFPKLLNELGIQNFYLQGLLDYNDQCTEQQLFNNGDLFIYLDEIYKQCEKFSINILMPLSDRLLLERRSPKEAKSYFGNEKSSPGETKQCNVPWEIPFIDREGRVFPCCNASRNSDAIMGNLRDEKWEQVWNGPAFKAFRNGLLEGGDKVPSICQDCHAVSWGQHPLLYAAKILPNESRLSGRGQFKLVVQNIGRESWTQNDPIYIATAAPRDVRSRFTHSTWLSPTRVAHFQESLVNPGERATFEFELSKHFQTEQENFELVYEGKLWMPKTQFQVKVPWGIRARINHFIPAAMEI